MPLVPSQLSSGLRDQWLPGDDGPYPQSAMESGQKFADVVSQWMANAMAGGIPCATAAARAPQLAALAAQALQARTAPGAGQMLASAIGMYVVGQLFGPGVAGPPAALGGLGPQLAATFGDTGMERSQRADAIANAIYTTLITTIVTFPPPPGGLGPQPMT